jgi:hypothetical protein
MNALSLTPDATNEEINIAKALVEKLLNQALAQINQDKTTNFFSCCFTIIIKQLIFNCFSISDRGSCIILFNYINLNLKTILQNALNALQSDQTNQQVDQTETQSIEDINSPLLLNN